MSKKFKRRLTIRTIAEAQALRKHSKEAIHVLFYAAELVRERENFCLIQRPTLANSSFPPSLRS